jgi:hypothetical protein
MRTILGLLLCAVPIAAQDPPRAGAEQVHVTAIEVVADVRDAEGNVPPDLKPADFILLEDEVERTIVGVDYLRAERSAGAVAADPQASAPAEETVWHNVIYFETTLSHGPGRITAAREMMKHVDALTRMGTVDVVFANPSPVALIRKSRDPGAIRAALQKVASFNGINRLAAHRRAYLREFDNINSLSALLDHARPTSEAPLFDPTNPRQYIDEEVAMISDFRQSLMAWLSLYRRHVPRNLLLVTDGFDVDPVAFYGGSLRAGVKMALRGYVSQSTLAESAALMATTLATGGWTTLLIPSDNNADGWVDDASTSGIARIHAGTVSDRNSSPKALLIRPLDPLGIVADVTGGAVVPNSGRIGSTLKGLDDRLKFTYQVDRRPDGKARRIEVRPREPGLQVRTARFATSATPDDVARTRAVELLKAASYTGDLPAEATIEWDEGARKIGLLRAVTNVDLVKQLLPAGAKAHFRITLAVQVGKNAVIVNRAVTDYDITGAVFRFRTPLELPRNASDVVIVVEETTTGAWGSARVKP